MFPEELKAYPQWVLWRSVARPGGEFTKLPYSAVGSNLASSSDSATWSTFEIAAEAAKRLVTGVGFVLTENDPYAFIDLDDPFNGKIPKDQLQAVIEMQTKIVQSFDSYSELSPSQKGLHIIVKGAVRKGRRRNNVEIYSSGRFMTMTGLTYLDKPIADRSELLRVLWDEIGGSDNGDDVQARESEQKYDDSVIHKQASEATNGDKFLSLWNGHWLDAGYTSQSEADFALVNILSFYSRNAEQIKRMFFLSALGKRDKAKRKAYLDQMIRRSFDNQPPYIDLSELDANLKKQIIEKPNGPSYPPADVNPFAGPLFANVPDPGYDYTTPPGLLGEIASFIYESSPRQVKEIALAASIGLMAGICGRAYNVSRTGLNQYVLLLAKTGTGKEGMVSGIDKIMREVRIQCPSAMEFLGPSAIASGQALIKHLSKQPCFVSIVGEFGLMLQAMCGFNANPSQIILRKVLLELYMKSGHDEVLRSTIYSDKDKNTPVVASPSFSMLGESTPHAYYGGLDETMIAQGLLPRFLCIEYTGKVPHLNKKHTVVKPPESLVNRVAEVAVNCFTLMQNGRALEVTLDVEAQTFADEFSRNTTDNINNSELSIAQELWNRAHLKMLKLSALIAVGNNPYEPVVTLEAMQWSHNLIERDIKNVFARFEKGEIGKETNETNQMGDIEEMVKDYLVRPFDDQMRKYMVDQRHHADRVVTWNYLQRRTSQKGSFRNDRSGATVALKRCIESLVLDGSIREVRQIDMQSRYHSIAKAYAVTEVHRFIR